MNLELFQAYWSLNKIPTHDLPQRACELLKTNESSNALSILAGLSSSEDPKTINRYLEETINQLNIQKLPETEAVLVIARSIAKNIVEKKIPPLEGARKIWWELWTDHEDIKELAGFALDATDYEEIFPKDETILESIIERSKRLLSTDK